MKITLRELRQIVREAILHESGMEKLSHPTPERYLEDEDWAGIVGKNPAVSFTPSVGKEILWKVIADEGASKAWDDLIPLDGGTVGIAHFAARGLGALYEAMGDRVVEKYFSKYNESIVSVEEIKKATRVGGEIDGWCRKGSASPVRGTCWASMPWWKKGMEDFLKSEESKEIQVRAWIEVTAKPANELIERYKSVHPEWESMRGRSIAYSLVNSGGKKMLIKFSNRGALSPNDTMNSYNIAKGRIRKRMINLNRLYPDPEFKPSFGAGDFKS